MPRCFLPLSGSGATPLSPAFSVYKGLFVFFYYFLETFAHSCKGLDFSPLLSNEKTTVHFCIQTKKMYIFVYNTSCFVYKNVQFLFL
ncbi:hypothetical protein BREVNS_0739 [Brevinematales bacterium NS]|nr:hypothetical protein BREVNS_0739 [Brevinematales bacterium NS]